MFQQMEIDLVKPGYYCPGVPARPYNSIKSDNGLLQPLRLRSLASDKIKVMTCYAIKCQQNSLMPLRRFCELSEKKQIRHAKLLYARIGAVSAIKSQDLIDLLVYLNSIDVLPLRHLMNRYFDEIFEQQMRLFEFRCNEYLMS